MERLTCGASSADIFRTCSYRSTPLSIFSPCGVISSQLRNVTLAPWVRPQADVLIFPRFAQTFSPRVCVFRTRWSSPTRTRSRCPRRTRPCAAEITALLSLSPATSRGTPRQGGGVPSGLILIFLAREGVNYSPHYHKHSYPNCDRDVLR